MTARGARRGAAGGTSKRWRGLLLAFWIALPAVAGAQAGAPLVAFAQDAASGTDDLYYLDLGSGAVTHADRLRRDPLAIRARRIGPNLLREIGRPVYQPAAVGEILLGPIRTTGANARAALFVETSTGFVAFFDQLGKNDVFGRISTAIGRPFAPVASPDGNYALLMRHDGNGRTEGAYLYHASGGRAFHLGGLAGLEIDQQAQAASGFPSLGGRVCATELQSFDRTVGYLVADAADGSLRYLDLESTLRVSVRDSPVGLFPTFAADQASESPQRFAAAPIHDSSETTTHVLFVDAATGDMAVLAGVEDSAGQPILTRLAANLYAVLGTEKGGRRVIAAVPGRRGNGATSGVWLIDSLTRGFAYLENAETPGSATVSRVTVGR